MKALVMILLGTTLMLACPVQAEQKEVLGDWDVHYMVVESTFLTPDIAKAYGIVRSRYNALINISVLNKSTKKAQSVGIEGTATNLLGNAKSLAFKEVQEGNAIYYLAVFSFRNEEQYRFNIKLNSGTDKQTLRFERKMYVE